MKWISSLDAVQVVRLMGPFLFSFACISIFVSFSRQVSALQEFKQRFNAFKYNAAVFYAWLTAGRPVEAGTADLSIRLGGTRQA